MSTHELSFPVTTRTYEETEHRSFETLLDALRRAEPAAVGEVYDLHHEAVRAFCRRLVGDEAAAEDLVHDVFVALPKAVRSFRGEASFRTFLISIAVNHARHHVRAAARRRAAMQRFAEARRTTEQRDMEGGALRLELSHALSRALDALPLKQRVAFVVCEVQGHTSVEAAAVVGVPEATIRTRLFHAKKALRALLEPEAST